MGFTCQPTIALVCHRSNALKATFFECIQQSHTYAAMAISSLEISRKQTGRSLENFVVGKIVASIVLVQKTGIHQLIRATQLQVLQFHR